MTKFPCDPIIIKQRRNTDKNMGMTLMWDMEFSKEKKPSGMCIQKSKYISLYIQLEIIQKKNLINTYRNKHACASKSQDTHPKKHNVQWWQFMLNYNLWLYESNMLWFFKFQCNVLRIWQKSRSIIIIIIYTYLTRIYA